MSEQSTDKPDTPDPSTKPGAPSVPNLASPSSTGQISAGPGPQPVAPTPSTATLAVGFPCSEFDHGVQGAAPLTREGVQVPVPLVAEIEAIARKYGVKVVQIIVDDAEEPVARFVRRVQRFALRVVDALGNDLKRI